jgi:hypothetical protein
MSEQEVMPPTTVPAEDQPEPKLPDAVKRPPPAVIGSHTSVAPIIPTNTQEVASMAAAICASGVVPDSYTNKDGSPNKGLVAMGIMRGLEVGFAPMTALQWVMPVNGRFSIWGDGAIALLFERKALKTQKIVWTDGTMQKVGSKEVLVKYDAPPVAGLPRDQYKDELQCEVKLTRSDGEVFTNRFSVMDARIAGLWSDSRRQPWQRYPARMIMNRARAFAIRDGFANYLNGLYIREEAEDMPPLRGFEPEVAIDTSALRGSISAIAPPVHEAIQEVVVEDGGVPASEINDVITDTVREMANSEARIVDDERDELALMKRVLNADTLEQIDDVIDTDGRALDFWRTDQPDRYARIMEQVNARREAKRK